MKPENIEEIRKRIKDEWLLIDVTKVDKYNQPLEGQLLAHTKDRDEIWRRFRENKGDLLVEFSGEPLEEGTVAMF
jgi:hypothetical protein